MNPNQNSLTQDPTRVRSHNPKPDPRAEKRTDPSLYLNLFFKDGYTPQEAMQKFFLEFFPPISDICQLPHFCPQRNLQFSELNITPSVGPNLGIFKNFWNWISTFRQLSLVKKTQFELNLTSFKWALPRSASSEPPSSRLGKFMNFRSRINSKYYNKQQFGGGK